METGQALADYLQHERPMSGHPAIFVRQVAGVGFNRWMQHTEDCASGNFSMRCNALCPG